MPGESAASYTGLAQPIIGVIAPILRMAVPHLWSTTHRVEFLEQGNVMRQILAALGLLTKRGPSGAAADSPSRFQLEGELAEKREGARAEWSARNAFARPADF